MTATPETPPEPAPPEPSAGEQTSGEVDAPENGSAAVSGTHDAPGPVTAPPCSGEHPPSAPVAAGAVQCGGHLKCCGHRCGQPALRGARVCIKHGASASQVQAAARRRLMEATDPVAARLVGVALKAGAKDADVIRAAAEVLDRAGIPRRTEVGIDEAQVRRDIADRLAALDVPATDTDPAVDLELAESPGEESPADDDSDNAGPPVKVPVPCFNCDTPEADVCPGDETGIHHLPGAPSADANTPDAPPDTPSTEEPTS